MQEQYTRTLPKSHPAKLTPGRAVNLLTMACIAVLIVLRDVGGIGVGRIVFIVLATIVCLLSDKAGIYCLLAFLTPLASGISLTYISGIALVCLLFKQRNSIRINKIGSLCMVIILLLELLSAFRGMFSILEYFRFSCIFLMVFLRMFDYDKNYDNERMLKYYLIGFGVVVISIFGQMLTDYSMSQIFSLGVRFGNTRQLLGNDTEGMLISYNPNGLGCLCILALIFSIIIARENKSKLYYLVAVLSGIFGIMTQSRTFIIELVVCVILFVFSSMSSVKRGLGSIFGILFGGAALYWVAQKLIPSYLYSLVLRFQDADISNGRTEIFGYYMSRMWEHLDRLVLGVGLQNYPDKYGYAMSAHNGTQEVVIAWGILGIIVVAIMMVKMFSWARFQNRNAFLYRYIPVIAVLVFVQTGQWFSDTSGLFRLMVAFSAILIPIRSELQSGSCENNNGGRVKRT